MRAHRLLAELLEKAIENLEASYNYSLTNLISSSCFDSTTAPSISLSKYIDRIHQYSNCSESCYVLAFIYIDRLLQNYPNFALTKKSAHRLVLTSILLAIKYLDDLYYNNSVYAMIGGISLAEINHLEKNLITLLHYNLHIDQQLFLQYDSRIKIQYQKIIEEKNQPTNKFKQFSKSLNEATSTMSEATIPPSD